VAATNSPGTGKQAERNLRKARQMVLVKIFAPERRMRVLSCHGAV
jgi:hypothetical protein